MFTFIENFLIDPQTISLCPSKIGAKTTAHVKN